MHRRTLLTVTAVILVSASLALAWRAREHSVSMDTTASSGERGGAGAPDTQPGAGAGVNTRGGGGRSPALVITRPVDEAIAGDRLAAIGDGEARASVSVTPRESGVLTGIEVASGDTVATGDILVRLDEELQGVAREIAARAVADATRARDRLSRLMEQGAGAQADLDEAENALARARLSLKDAELRLQRRRVRAPIGGRVGIVEVDVGDRVDDGTPIVTIDDRSSLLIDFRVPEAFARRVAVGQPMRATPFADGEAIDGMITAVGNRVSRDSRTLPVRASIDNTDDRLRPGMAFSVEVRFEGEPYPSVDPLALQWDAEGSYVWKVVDGRAARTAARIVQRETDRVLVDAALVAGDAVVTEGVLSLRDGAAVRTAGDGPRGPGEQRGATPAASAASGT